MSIDGLYGKIRHIRHIFFGPQRARAPPRASRAEPGFEPVPAKVVPGAAEFQLPASGHPVGTTFGRGPSILLSQPHRHRDFLPPAAPLGPYSGDLRLGQPNFRQVFLVDGDENCFFGLVVDVEQQGFCLRLLATAGGNDDASGFSRNPRKPFPAIVLCLTKPRSSSFDDKVFTEPIHSSRPSAHAFQLIEESS